MAKMLSSRLWLVTVLLACLAPAFFEVVCADDQLANSVVERAQLLANQLDRSAGAIFASGGISTPQRQELEDATKDLDQFLNMHHDDAEALVIDARLTLWKQLFQPLTIQFNAHAPAERQAEMLKQLEAYASQLDSIHLLLDRAIAAAPDNAEAYFLKARLHALTQPSLRQELPVFLSGRFAYEAQVAQAIRFAQRAVELEPTNLQYRAEYAQYLIMAEQFDDAFAVISEVKGDLGLLYQILSDLKTLPKPAGAIPSAKAASTFAEMVRGSYRVARIRAYLVPGTAAELQNFYQRYWPEFRLLQPEKKDVGMYFQFLSASKQGWRAARSIGDIPQQRPNHGVYIIIKESTGPLIYERGEHYPFSPVQVYCYIWMINYRDLSGVQVNY